MNLSSYLSAGAALLCCLACEPSDPPVAAPFSAFDRRVEDSLALLRADYDSLHLWEALGRGRRLQSWLTERKDSVRGEHLVEVYQWMGMLHFERGMDRDSILYYTLLVDELVRPDSPVEIRARQSLCHAYESYGKWAPIEMDLHCEVGIRILDSAGVDAPTLRAALLLAQGRARKQSVYRQEDTTLRRRMWLESEQLLLKALRTHRTTGSPHTARALEELGIVYARYPPFTPKLTETINALNAEVDERHTGYLHPLRLRAYVHRYQNQPDSAIACYEALLNSGDYFRRQYYSESYFILRDLRRSTGKFTAALQTSRVILAESECCTFTKTKHSEEINYTQCLNADGCVHDIAEHAHILLQRYLQSGDEYDLLQSFSLCQTVLDSYVPELSGASEESVLNRTISLGDRIINVALLSSFLQLRTDPQNIVYSDAFFRAVELGKSHLLVRELKQISASRSGRTDANKTDESRLIAKEVALLSRSFTADGRLPAEELRRFSRITQRRRALERTASHHFYQPDDEPSEVFSLPAVARQLSPEDALIEFAETPTHLFVLYVDSDTTIIYPVDTAVRSGVATFADAVQSLSQSTRVLDSLGERLYTNLLGKVHKRVAAHANLMIVPSPSLSHLPFAALTRPALEGKAAYLVNFHSIRYLDSWRAECENVRRRGMLPTYDIRTVGFWTHPDLKSYFGALNETLTTDYLANTASALVGHTGNFTSWIERYDMLHLSVHARGNSRVMNENYIYLSDRDSLNGIHISRLNLRANLVVLAACSTDRGPVRRRAGTFSLRRSFHRAGVPDVVSSQFDIPAAATAGILNEFYRNLGRGHTVAASLSRAQRVCISGKLNARWRHPRFWAGLALG